ncbi:MAG: site-specific integrase [Bacteroidales bacterium]|nr:site-specific integrase [Bacteroidales bacterium]
MSVKYYLDKRESKLTKEHPIRVSAVVNGTRVLSTTGYSVKEKSWDEKAQRVKPHQTNAKKQTSAQINKYLNGVEGVVLDFENTCRSRPAQDKLKEIINSYDPNADPDEEGINTEPRRKSVVEYFEEFCREEKVSNQWTRGTVQIWDAFKKHLTAVTKGASFDFFNDDGIRAFVRHLRTKANMQENTVQKHYLNLRWFLNWAIREGYASIKEIGKIQPKFKLIDQPVIFLTKDELMKLYRYEVPANGTKVKLHSYEGIEYEKVVHDAGALAKTRDLFCFCAFTSLRYSDMANLKQTDISGDILYITTQKTHNRLPININSFAREILDKYKDSKFPYGQALPVITNQKMNDYIKDLCELCEINEPITSVCYRGGQREETTKPKYNLMGTHAGRRTFICFALSSGIPPQVVMKWTGHKDYKAMKPYIDIAEKVKAEQMAIFEKGLKGESEKNS